MTSTDQPKTDSAASNPSRVNPYVGPRPYQPGEELFGRDREKRDLFDQLLAERIVLLHSPSGAGKSSLVNAGLIPMVRQEGLHVLPIVRVGEEPPEKYASQSGFNRFIYSMMLSLEGELAEPVPEQDESGEPEMGSEAEQAAQEAQRQARLDKLAGMSLKDYLAQRRQPLETDLNVIIFDQFEEIITVAATDLYSKRVFFNKVGEVLSDRSLWALFVIRDDFLGALEPFALSIPTQLTNTFRLDLLSAPAAQQAIQKPVARQGITFQEAAAQKLVDDLRLVQTQAPGGEIVSGLGLYVEPVQLQVVCLRLYDQLDLANRLDKSDINEEDIKKVGDVGKALADYYAERVKSVADSQQLERLVRDWFDEKLITKSGLRSQVMMEVGSSGGLDNKIIRQLERAHLVRAEKRRGVTWFELAHDRLVRPVLRDNERWRRKNLSPWQLRAIEWQKNGQPDELLLRGNNLDLALAWAKENPATVHAIDEKYLQASSKWRETHLSPLQRKAAEWEAQGHPQNLLLSGSELQQAAEWAMANTDEITSREMGFLDASQSLALEEERKKREQAMQLEFERQRADEQEKTARRLRIRAIALGVAAFVAVIMFITAMFSLNSARVNASQNATLALQNKAYGDEQSVLRITSEAFGAAQSTLAFEQASLADQRSTQAAENAALAAAESTLSSERREQAAINARIALTALAQEATAVFNAGQALSRQLASQSRSFLTRRPDLGILLAVEAYQVDSSNGDARSVLLEGLSTGLDQSVVPYEVNIPTGQENTNNVNISPDGELVLWSGTEGKITLWDIATRTSKVLQDPEGTFITAQAISPTDPNLLVTGNINSQLLFWDLSGGSFERVRAIGTSSTGTRYNHGRVRRLEFSPDGRRLAIHGQSANIAIWDIGSRSELLSFKAQPDFYWDLDWSADGRYLAAAGGDNFLYVFDPISGNRLIRQENPDADGRIYNVDWSPEGEQLAFVGASGTRFARVYFFNMATRTVLPDSLQSDSSALYTVSFNHPQGELVVAAGSNTPVEIWRLADATKLPPLPTYGDYQNGLAFEDDLLAYVGFNAISIYQVKDPQPLSSGLEPFGGNSPVVSSYSTDELWLAGVSGRNLRLEQRIGDQNQVSQPGAGFPARSSAYQLVLSPDRSLYAAPQGTGELYHWDPSTVSSELVSTDIPTTTRALGISADGDRLAAGYCTQGSVERLASLCSVQLYDLQSYDPLGEPISTTQSTISSLAFSPDSATLASGDQNGTIYLVDLSGGELGEIPLGGFSVGYTALAFSPDGSTLAAGSDQGLIYLWDVKSGQALGKPFELAGQPITGLAFSQDGTLLYAADQDGQASAWDVDLNSWVQRACVLAGRSLTAAEWRQFLGDLPFNPACQESNQATATTTPTPTGTPSPTP